MLTIRNVPSNCRVPLEYVAYRRSARCWPLLAEHVMLNVIPSTLPQPTCCTLNDGEMAFQPPPDSTCANACGVTASSPHTSTSPTMIRSRFTGTSDDPDGPPSPG